VDKRNGSAQSGVVRRTASRGAAVFACWLASTVAGQSLELGPQTFPLKIFGLEVGVPVSADATVRSEANLLIASVSAVGDLKEVQDNALQIARGVPWPDANCTREGVNVVVNRIDRASIAADSDTAVLFLAGHVTAWVCKKIFGNEAKTILLEDDVELSAPIRAKVIDPHHVGLELAGKPVLTTSALTREATDLLLGDMDASLSRELTKALDADSARASFPEVEGVDGSFESAGFVPGSLSLRLAIAGTTRITAAALGVILAKYGKKDGK
jgi:hypothetical protein